MKLPIIKSYFFIILISIISSCSEDDPIEEDTNNTFLDYRVAYDSDLDQTTVSAHFTSGFVTGNDIVLADNESVTFAGDQLSFDDASGEYMIVYPGRIMEGTFEFISAEGKTYTNTLFDYESIEFPSGFSTLSKSEDLNIEWVGSSIMVGEHLEIYIGNPDQGVLAAGYTEQEGVSSVLMDTQELDGLVTGSWPASMIRTKVEYTYDEGTTKAGSRVVAKYYAKVVQVEVTE